MKLFTHVKLDYVSFGRGRANTVTVQGSLSPDWNCLIARRLQKTPDGNCQKMLQTRFLFFSVYCVYEVTDWEDSSPTCFQVLDYLSERDVWPSMTQIVNQITVVVKAGCLPF